jgi:hypothetical protein
MPDAVKDACEACFADHANDCSGFAKAAASRLRVTLQGLANDIVDEVRRDAEWTRLANGVEAAREAAAGKLVIGGLRGDEQTHPDEHGHVVIVVDGPLAHDKYPSAYWGKLHGGGKENQTVNWAWTEADRDNVTYAAHDITPAIS